MKGEVDNKQECDRGSCIDKNRKVDPSFIALAGRTTRRVREGRMNSLNRRCLTSQISQVIGMS